MDSLRASLKLSFVVQCYIGTGTSMAGQAMAGSFFQLSCPLFMLMLCVLVPGINSGR